MRLYGYGSWRLATDDLPDAPDTTLDESEKDYESVVSLEPEIFRQVILDHGQNPERLTFIRKARGLEAHKGGQPINPSDKGADDCLTSWLRSAVDATACKAAVPRLASP
jgi:hypothetical protein